MAKHHNQMVERIELGESKVARPAGLAALERESLLPVRTPQESAAGVRLYESASPFDECEHAAAYIRRKVRDEGARCRDFVVAARDIEPYSAFLAMAMARYDIPVHPQCRICCPVRRWRWSQMHSRRYEITSI